MLPEEFVINVGELQKGSKNIDRDLPLEWLAEMFAHCEYTVLPIEGHLKAQIEDISSGILVRGDIEVAVQSECGTCLNELRWDLSPKLDAFLMPKIEGQQIDNEVEFTPEDLSREWYEGDTVNLQELIHDSIMLALPMNPRCQGPCKKIEGLITAEEAEKRKPIVDPRLASLADIVPSKEN